MCSARELLIYHTLFEYFAIQNWQFSILNYSQWVVRYQLWVSKSFPWVDFFKKFKFCKSVLNEEATAISLRYVLNQKNHLLVAGSCRDQQQHSILGDKMVTHGISVIRSRNHSDRWPTHPSHFSLSPFPFGEGWDRESELCGWVYGWWVQLLSPHPPPVLSV